MKITAIQTPPLPTPIQTVSGIKASNFVVNQLLQETWYFSGNFSHQEYKNGDKIVYNKKEWEVIRSTKSPQGYAYQLKFIRQILEEELQTSIKQLTNSKRGQSDEF